MHAHKQEHSVVLRTHTHIYFEYEQMHLDNMFLLQYFLQGNWVRCGFICVCVYVRVLFVYAIMDWLQCTRVVQ